MALAERGSGSGTSVAGSPVSVTLSAAPVAGDLILVFFVGNANAADAHPTPSFSGSSSLGTSTASSYNRLHALGKIATGSEGTSLSVSYTGSADHAAVGALVISGASSSLPTNVITTADASSDTTVSIAAITTAAANSWDVVGVCFGGNNDYPGASANYSAWGSSLVEKFDLAASSGGFEYAGLGVAYVARASAGSQAATSVTQSTSDVAGVIRLEVAEAGGAATPTPPSFVAAGTPAFTATASATLTPGLPSGWAANDIHLLIASGNNNLDWPEPSGWTKLSPGAVAENNTANMRVELWARRAVGGDSAPVLSTYTGTTVRGAQIVGFRNCPTSGTVDTVIAAMSRSNNASSTTATFATLTPGSGNPYTRIVALLAYQDNITTAATLTGFSAFDMAAGQQTALGNDMALSYAHRTWVDGSVATGSLTSLTSGAAANVSVGILLALEPIPVGTTVDVSASPASAAGTAVNPTVVLGSVTVTLTSQPASAAGTAVNPTLRQGSLTLTPGAASAAGTAVDPTVSIAGGGLTVNVSAAPASAAGAAVSPSVIQSSLTLTPGAASAAGTAITPTVTITGGGLTVDVSASPASAASSAISPSVRQSSLTVNLSAVQASAVGTAVNPTVTIAGGGLTVNLTAVPASASGTAVSPSVRQGSVTVDVGAAAAIGTAISPSVRQGSLILSLASLPALAVGTAVSPSVVLVEAFDFPLSALSVVARPGASSTAARPGAGSSTARAGATSTAPRPGATSLATRPASTSEI